MGFTEMSCREPEEVSYGSEEQRGSSLTKRLQIPLIITLSVKKGTHCHPAALSLSLSPPPHLVSLWLTLWGYVKHPSSVSANEVVDRGDRSQR